jgi:MFS family permease
VPQPSDDPNDPLNWPSWKKHTLLILVAFAGWNADFCSGVGIPALGLQAVEWGMTPNGVNEAGNLGVLMLGIGGLFWIPMIHYWGRAPTIFWTQFIGTMMILGCAVTPNFAGYYAFRALQTFFLTSGQTVVLTVIKDMFFFHELARKIGTAVLIFYAAPYVAPQLSGFMIYGLGEWRPSFWMAFAWGAMLVFLIICFYDETYYDRQNPYPRPPYSQKRRLLELIGYYGFVEPRRPFLASHARLLAVIVKPIIFPLMIFFMMTYMWAIGINITSSILIGSPVDVGGYGLSLKSTSFLYFTPVVALIIGEWFGHWFNDFLATRYVKRHQGLFIPETRLWPNYLAVALMIPGLVICGEALENKWNVGTIVIGWGLYMVGVIISSVCTTSYTLDCYPNAAGEVMVFMTLARVMVC